MGGRIPVEHGQEIEQHPSRGLPAVNWSYDHGGIKETSIGPYKQVKRIIESFNEDMKEDHGSIPWRWHAADSSTPGTVATGCGSHAHLKVDASSEDSKVEEWTIAWNTAVTLAPVFSPFFCFDWDKGFREGTLYGARNPNIKNWASPMTTRYSTTTMRDHVTYPDSVSRSYKSVTMNPRVGSKPMTIEFRMNENHPTFAMVGLHFMKRLIKWSIEDGWSPKLDTSNGASIADMYNKVYDRVLDSNRNLVQVMKEEMNIVFERSIPRIDREEFDSMWDLFTEVLSHQGTGTGAYDQRVKHLVREAGELEFGNEDSYSPANNTIALWNVTDEEFSWDSGPEVN